MKKKNSCGELPGKVGKYQAFSTTRNFSLPNKSRFCLLFNSPQGRLYTSVEKPRIPPFSYFYWIILFYAGNLEKLRKKQNYTSHISRFTNDERLLLFFFFFAFKETLSSSGVTDYSFAQSPTLL